MGNCNIIVHGRLDYNTLSLKYKDLTYYKIFSPCFRTQKSLVIYARLLLSLQKDLIVTYVMSIPVHDIIVISVLKGELIFSIWVSSINIKCFNSDVIFCFSFPSKTSLKSHLKQYNTTKAYVCDLCEFSCNYISGLKVSI